MRVRVKSSTVSRLIGVVAAVWLCASGSAWAGDGANLTSIQAIIGKPDGSTGFCHILNMTTCPQLPTVTQAILEAAGLGLSPPEMVAAQNSIPPGGNVYAGNPASPFVPFPFPFPLNAATSPTLSDLLSTLTPLAFESAGKQNQQAAAVSSAKKNQGMAAATQLYDPDADTFLYSVAVSTFGEAQAPGGTSPDTLLLFYDDLGQTNSNFSRGQTVAKFSLPLTVLNSDGTERAVAATLHFIAPPTDCSASKVVGDFMGTGKTQRVKATDIALNCAVVFGPSPPSPRNHAIFEVAVPLLVTGACSPTASSTDFCPPPPPWPAQLPPPNTDPAYFYQAHNPGKQGPINTGLFTAFLFDDLFGAPAPANPPILGANGIAIGIAPTAGPLGPPPTCTGTNCTPPPSTFALCASLPQNVNGSASAPAVGASAPMNGNGQALVPAVGAYYAIATDGEALLSAALPGVSTSACPPL